MPIFLYPQRRRVLCILSWVYRQNYLAFNVQMVGKMNLYFKINLDLSIEQEDYLEHWKEINEQCYAELWNIGINKDYRKELVSKFKGAYKEINDGLQTM